jgi:DNA-binding transcriptional LysR family regulator
MGRRGKQSLDAASPIDGDGQDWNALRSFAAVVRHGSLSKAARELRRTQPTLGRHIDQLEMTLGQPMFERGRQGLALAKADHTLADKADDYLAASDAAIRCLVDVAERPAGPVTVAIWSLVAKVAMLDVIERLTVRYPLVRLNQSFIKGLDDDIDDEIDVSIRCFPPQTGDYILRRVTSVRSAFYATPALIETVPSVQTATDICRLPFVVPKCDEPVRIVAAAAGLDMARLNFVLRSDADDIVATAMQKGIGVGLMPMIAKPESLGLSRVLPGFHIDFPCYVVASNRMRRSRRIRAVFDCFVETLPALMT